MQDSEVEKTEDYEVTPPLNRNPPTMPQERKLYNVNISGLTLIQDWLNKKPT
jgi:hypothetical protein